MKSLGILLAGSMIATSAFAVEIIGHRGASRDAPENTLASVNLAWKRGADAVEIDVWLSKDGRIVAIHDETTKRYGGPDRKVADQTLAELKTVDAGRWKDKKFTGERIPTLAEVVATIPAGKRLFIEIKCGPQIVGELKRVLEAAEKKPGQTAIISFSYDVVRAVKRDLPDLKVYWVAGLKRSKLTRRLSPSLAELIRKTTAAKLDGLDLGHTQLINAAMVRKIKQAGLGLCVWTVNSAEEARRLAELGVDGITTDIPGRLRKQLAKPPR